MRFDRKTGLCFDPPDHLCQFGITETIVAFVGADAVAAGAGVITFRSTKNAYNA
jgi:hypothetical protein